MRPRRTLPPAVALLAALTLAAAPVAQAAPGTRVAQAAPAAPAARAAAAPARRIVWTRWDSDAELAQGSSRGVAVVDGALRPAANPARTRGGYDVGTWTSPWVEPGFDLTELIASWEATTPGDSRVDVEVRGRVAGRATSWDTLARWALDDAQAKRSSSPDSQSDDGGRTAYDTWLTSGAAAWQVRVSLLRRTGTAATPTVEMVGAMVSRLPDAGTVATSDPGTSPALGTVLDVPRYSQMVHDGEYPQYDGGGEAWCSPTSTTMVLGYYDALPPRSAYRWVRADYPDRVVPHVARMTYDSGFGGTGNWPFNTAYAASRTGHAFVTRLRSLTEAQRFIAAGIPLVASLTFSAGELQGSPIRSTAGHIMVIVGFRKNGDVVVNDPAAPNRSSVRRTYDRGEFEDAWLKRYAVGGSMRGSGGLVYVITDEDHPLPDRLRNRNW